MNTSHDSFPYQLAHEEHELETYLVDSDASFHELNWVFYDDIEAAEEPEQDDVFYDNASDSDVEWDEADEEITVDEEYVQDYVEYVHFGKGLEYDGERWIWEEDVD
ncbi:hypothetical protein F1880_001642 [Penicillium rolfsii]|nr:hypothetical protein F1880_001642 [Penicillium rolfsii]